MEGHYGQRVTSDWKKQCMKSSQIPTHTKAIEVKWVFKLKHNPYGSIARHKEILVARGFLQRAGLNYSEVYPPVARLETVT